LNDASLAANSSGTITLDVQGVQRGLITNTTSAVRADDVGAGYAASATIAVGALPPTISKSFDATAIPLNGTTRLTITITNPAANAGIPLTGVAFTDTLPAGLAVASPPSLTSTAGGNLTAVAGSHTISLSGGTLVPNSTATITVDVTGTT